MAITKLLHFKEKTGLSGLKRGIEYIFDKEHDRAKLDGDLYDHVFTTHTDKNHIHSHIIFNSVSAEGLKYRYTKGQWETDIQRRVNRLCEKYGLSTIDLIQNDRGKSDPSTKMTWKRIIREDIDETIAISKDFDDFIARMKEQHYDIRFGVTKNKKILERLNIDEDEMPYFSIKGYGMDRARRNYNLGKDYTIDNIEFRIRNSDYIRKTRIAALDNHPVLKPIGENFSSRKAKSLSGIQRVYYFRVQCAYHAYYRWQKPYSESWKYKKDLVEMQSLLERLNYVYDNKISSVDDLKKKQEELRDQQKALKFSKNELYRKLDAASEVEKAGVSREIKTLNEMAKDKFKEEKLVYRIMEEYDETGVLPFRYESKQR